MLNIPIYRAKKIDSDENVISSSIVKSKAWNKDKGYYYKYYLLDDNTEADRFPIYLPHAIEIDPSTLSIHFPDMIASDSDRLLPNGEKDLRIFASLSEDGKGGDIFQDYYVCVYSNMEIKVLDLSTFLKEKTKPICITYIGSEAVIGIQQ